MEADPAAPVRDIDVGIYDSTGANITAAVGTPNGLSGNVPEILELALTAGTYYVRVRQFESPSMAVAEDYSLLVETF